MDAELEKIRGEAQKATDELQKAEKEMERYNNKKKDEEAVANPTGIPGLV